jgi:hypothetical protein
MTLARVALALWFVVSALQTSRAEPCAPRADLGGDAEAVAKVAVELERLGVDASTDPLKRRATTCPVIVAAVELDASGGIAVAVRDRSQRSEGRVVSDAALAAAWIDSWLRDDFTSPAVETVPAPIAAQPPPAEAAARAAPPLLERFALAASYLMAWTDDSTTWSGIGGSLCIRAGGFCVGARVSYATQSVATDFSVAAKEDVALLATASYSHSIGTMSIAPELGIGVGRAMTARYEDCVVEPVMSDPNCNPMDPTCMSVSPPPKCEAPGQIYVGDDFSAATYTPRLSGALRIAIPLFDHVWLDGLAAATIAPFGHADDYAAGTESGGTMTMPASDSYPLPGDSLFGIQLGIGLRVGSR